MNATIINQIEDANFEFITSLETILHTKALQKRFETYLLKKIQRLEGKYEKILLQINDLSEKDADKILNELTPYINLLYSLHKQLLKEQDSPLKQRGLSLYNKITRLFMKLEQISDSHFLSERLNNE